MKVLQCCELWFSYQRNLLHAIHSWLHIHSRCHSPFAGLHGKGSVSLCVMVSVCSTGCECEAIHDKKTTMVALSEGSLSNSNVHGAFPNLPLGFISVNTRLMNLTLFQYHHGLQEGQTAHSFLSFFDIVWAHQVQTMYDCYKHNYMDRILRIIHNSFDDFGVSLEGRPLLQFSLWQKL